MRGKNVIQNEFAHIYIIKYTLCLKILCMLIKLFMYSSNHLLGAGFEHIVHDTLKFSSHLRGHLREREGLGGVQ